MDEGYMVVPDVLDGDLLTRVLAETTAICQDVMPSAALRDILCIHFPHKVSELFRQVARHPALVSALTSMIGPDVKMMQSMLFIKSEGKPGQAWHQDEAHIPTRDRSLTAAWIALDNATVDNGCLWVLPGSHRSGVLYPVRDQEDVRFDCTKEAYGFTDDDAIPVELPAGSALIFNGYLLHRSLPNNGRAGMRRALVNHYMSASSLLPWFPPSGDEAMGMLDHRDIELIAGKDPYAYKGTADLMYPHVRPERQGGCTPVMQNGATSSRTPHGPRAE
ncbi:phytanoyl-CoA dioxygenase family protein [Kibdelosporangium aridum]|uniref:Phytanoyl-CoA dioxygenase family protein n=1 Tax=Kibdelosporangium aridum TaxID=2030 RepID=A0A428ZP28_KIBAR|nr:phytanoyl-CoA dioxygenase family protein [Kibdelosporangium aridum]RSM89791.1 phytanoyl-CoA dioxygenase family protein [Kibdelosporangium aridum]